MEINEKNLYVNRIVSGQLRIKLKNEIFYIKSPTRIQRSIAEEIFQEQYEEALISGIDTQKALLLMLAELGIWTTESEATLKVCYDNIENLKVGLFESLYRSDHQEIARQALKITRSEILKLENIKHSYDANSCEGLAAAAKYRYLLGCSIHNANGTPYWESDVDWNNPDSILDRLAIKIKQGGLAEAQFRELARTEPWRSIWSLKKNCGRGVFDVASADLTDDQKVLMIWSQIYDSIYEHPESPDDSVVEDDDMIDGWMIMQRREAVKRKNKASLETKGSEKIRNSSEQFHVAKTMDDAKRIMESNDERTKQTLQQRYKVIKENGEAGVKEQELPDVQRKLKQEALNSFSARAKGKK